MFIIYVMEYMYIIFMWQSRQQTRYRKQPYVMKAIDILVIG